MAFVLSFVHFLIYTFISFFLANKFLLNIPLVLCLHLHQIYFNIQPIGIGTKGNLKSMPTPFQLQACNPKVYGQIELQTFTDINQLIKLIL